MQDTRELHNGRRMPVLGLGTYRMKAVDELRPVIQTAIRAGYRLIDSATVYKNEEALGVILNEIFNDRSFNVTRKDVFITSKLSPQDQGFDACYQAVQESLARFGLDYFDLYLIHWPGTAKKKLDDIANSENRKGSYKALERLYREGKLKQIGVSNYTALHLQELLGHSEIIPHVHQFELHPCLHQPDIIDICTVNHIQIQAYSSLGEGKLLHEIELKELDAISERLNKPKALILLRWAVQHGWAIIPKSKTEAYVTQNAKVDSFELSEKDMEYLDNIHRAEPHRFCWDPTTVK